MAKYYTIADLRKMVLESTSEFKPRKGSGVDDAEKRNNKEAVEKMMKDAKDYDGGLSKKMADVIRYEEDSDNDNLGMSDIAYDGIDDNFKKKVKSQMKGFNSPSEEKRFKKSDYAAEFNNDSFIKQMKKHATDVKKEKDAAKMRGLTGSTNSKSEVEKRNQTAFANESVIKNIKFKRTTFLSEGHMLSKVPDDFKFEGNRFMMSDANGNKYIVEWHNNDKPSVDKKVNQKAVNEEINRIKSLYNYNSGNYFKSTTPQVRFNENKEFSEMINKAKKLMK